MLCLPTAHELAQVLGSKLGGCEVLFRPLSGGGSSGNGCCRFEIALGHTEKEILMNWMKRGLLCLLAWCPLWLGASELADRLHDGRHVLLMRHAYAPGVSDPTGYSLQRCETQRLLNEEGRQQAVRAGHWLRGQGVGQARVHSSIWCRCQETAELLKIGPVRVEPALASFFEQPQRAAAQTHALQAFIARALRAQPASALVLVTHHVNIRAFMGRDIGVGDMVLARVDAQGRMVESWLYPSP